MISKQAFARMKIIVYNTDNGKTSSFYTCKAFVPHEPGGNLSRNKPLTPPATLLASNHHFPFKSQPPAIDFHYDHTTKIFSPLSAVSLSLTMSGTSKALHSKTPVVQASS